MGTAKPLQGLKHQAGYLMVGMSIALLAVSLATIGAARTSLNTWKENIGAGLGNQLQTVNDALAAYISAKSENLIANTAIALPAAVGGNVTNIYVPTIAELKSLGYLNTAAQATPTAGTAYVINIARPSVCTTGCVITGYVYLQEPIRGPDGKVSDIRLLGSAMNASKSNQIGFSLPASPINITGSGWSATNPDPSQRTGILYAITNFTYTPTASSSSRTQYWLSPAATYWILPASGNTLGDGRYVTGTRKPYMWNGSSWVEAYSDSNRNLSIGTESGKGGWDNVLTGYNAGYSNTTGEKNIFTGSYAGYSNTTGRTNAFTGYSAGYYNTTGNYNAFTGSFAGFSNTSGYNNVFTGTNAGYYTSTGNRNVFMGTSAGYQNSTGYLNLFTGDEAGYNNTSGYNNVFMGSNAGRNNTEGYFNLFDGSAAGYSNTTGYINAFTGSAAGYSNTTGFGNVFTGHSAGYSNTAGRYNVFTGMAAGYTNELGTYNTVYGAFADLNASNLTNASAFGNGAKANASNSVRIGNTSVTSIGGAVAWSNASDHRLKTDIQDTQRGLDFVLKLRPVDYLLKESKKHQTGFIAQEVEDIDPNFPGITKPANDKDFYSLTYTDFIPSLVKSIQELEARTASATQADALLQANVIRLMCAMLALLTALVVWLFCQNQVMRRKLDLL